MVFNQFAKPLVTHGDAKSGYRRKKQVACEQLERTAEGLRLHIRNSKTDQEGKGEFVEVVSASDPACCPVEALSAWTAQFAAWPSPPMMTTTAGFRPMGNG